MDIKQWVTEADDKRLKAAAREARTKVVYLEQIAKGLRRPSPGLCSRLLDAVPELSLRGIRPDLADLCDKACARKGNERSKV